MKPILLALLLAACSSPPVGNVCTPGAGRCNMNNYETCAGDGLRWLVAQDCSASTSLCIENLGCRACSPNALLCGNDGFDITRCNGDGTHLDTIGRCDPEVGQQCVGGACVDACDHAAATRSYEGCDYWATDLDNAVVSDLGTAAAQQYAIVVSNPLELPATVTVTVNDAPFGMPPHEVQVAQTYLSRVIGGGDLATIELPPRELDCSTDPRLNDGTNSCLSSNAYHVTSTAPIVAYQFNPLDNVGVFSNDASLLLPQSALGPEYMVMGWPQTLANASDPMVNAGIDLRAFLTIVGTTEASHVNVTLTTPTVGAAGIPAGMPGDTLSFTTGPYDVINVETGSLNADFTGTQVISDQPVAVFSGSEASDVPSFTTFAQRDCCADHMEEQLFALNELGTEFIAVKTPLRTKYVEQAGYDVALLDTEPEWFRVLGTAEDTAVTTNLPPPDDGFTLQRGAYRTIKTDRDFTLISSKPVSFAQFPGSQQTTGIPSALPGGVRPPGGDPSSMMVPPIQQWKSKYVFLVPDKYAFDFMLLGIAGDTKLSFDGEPLETALPRCEYQPVGIIMNGMMPIQYTAIRCPLSNPNKDDPNNPLYQNDGRHQIESLHGEPFSLMMWGWDSFVSYGYPGGTNLAVINPQ